METHKLSVANVKCGGCVVNIQNGLNDLAGITRVDVDQATGVVEVEGSIGREQLASKLAELGYPEVS